MERRPTTIHRGRQRLEVGRSWWRSTPLDDIEKAATGERTVRLEAENVEDGRKDIDVLHRRRDDATWQMARREQSERHAESRFIREEAWVDSPCSPSDSP